MPLTSPLLYVLVGLGCLLLLLRLEKHQPVSKRELVYANADNGPARGLACPRCGRRALWLRVSCPFCGSVRYPRIVLGVATMVVAAVIGARLHGEGVDVWRSVAFLSCTALLAGALLKVMGLKVGPRSKTPL